MWGIGKKRPSGSNDGSGSETSLSIRRLVAIAAVVVVAAAGALVAATSGNSALTGTALPASVGLSGWDTVSNSWTHGNTVEYAEKQAIPFQLDLSGLSTSSTYLVNICREFQNGTKYGFLFLEKYNKTINLTNAQAGGTVLNAMGPFSTVNATVTAVQDFTDAGGICASGERLVQATVQPTSATTSYLLWGGHLAAPGDTVPGSANLVGFGNGAGSYPGASLAMRLVSPDKTVPIPVNKIITLTKIDVTEAHRPGRHCRSGGLLLHRLPQSEQRSAGLRQRQLPRPRDGHVHRAGDGAERVPPPVGHRHELHRGAAVDDRQASAGGRRDHRAADDGLVHVHEYLPEADADTRDGYS